ncbi:MAG: FAD-dependent oxidoreductase [Spirochaetales bacterium]|nr:FAD-dependent oxidoreductase [Spirochaetales bacterium]
MEKREVIIVGAGPAGLSAAVEAATAGCGVLLIDENSKPGGQLFKQIHKFFGSQEHKAGIRGIDIGKRLLEEAENLHIEVWLDSEVCGIFDANKVWVVRNKKETVLLQGDRIIIATGASENAVHFPGWHLPGVMGAGAAQTMINIHRVLPGEKVLMVGSGNVGVIVSYQLLQAGAEVVGVIEAAPRLGGYGVHTAKVRRAGVPFFVSHVVAAAEGKDRVEKVRIVQVDPRWNPVPGTEKTLKADTICLATGLTPLTELAFLAGCESTYSPVLGGHVPWHNSAMRTSVRHIFIAGDISGVEEASTAMEEGRMAGLQAAASLGHVDEADAMIRGKAIQARLDALRSGLFGEKRKNAKESIFSAMGNSNNGAR